MNWRHVMLLALAVFAAAAAPPVDAPARIVVFGTVERLPPGADPAWKIDDAAFDQGLAAVVAKAAGLPFRFAEFKTAPEVLAALEDGRIDVIPSLGRTPERIGRLLFSVRHTVATIAAFMRDDRQSPATWAELAALRISAVRDSSGYTFLREKQLDAHALLTETTEEALRAVFDGRVDACLSNQLVGVSVARQMRLEHQIVPAYVVPDFTVDFCMAVRRSDGELLQRLNDGIALAAERGDLQRHREKWQPVFESYWLARPDLRRWLAGGGAALLLVALLGWGWHRSRLRAEQRLTDEVSRQVEQRTRELAAANTQLRTSEEAVRRLNAELETHVARRTQELAARVSEVERLNAELEAFSYSVSHDLRAPLRNVAGFLELLRARLAERLDAESVRLMGVASAESARMGTLIDGLLKLSQAGRGELRSGPVALDELVAEVRAELAPEIPARRIEWRVAPLPRVRGDRALLRQVIANLVGNAVKFSRHREPAVIEIGAAAPGTGGAGDGTVTCFVRDNGAGFNPKYADKLFGVFQRLHSRRDFEGTGIGLANVKRIVTRHGGKVWAEGNIDKGATFYFNLRVSP
jgi:signal transduction histidine kinase